MERRQICVLLSTFMCQFFFGSLLYGTARMLVAIIETFKTSRAEAAVVPAVYTSLLSCIGLPSGEIVHRFGAKRAGAVGSLIIGLSFSICFFATSLIYLVIAIGVFAGTGMSLLYISCTSIICEHFVGKSRLAALSCVIVGSGVGGMSVPYLLDVFLTEYGLRGTFLLLGGITLNLFGMVLFWNKPIKANTVASNSANLEDSVIQHITEIAANSTPMNNLKHVFTDKSFICFACGNAVRLAAISNAFSFVVDIMLDKFNDRSLGSLSIFVFSLSSLFGSFLPGLLKQIPRLSTLDTPIISTLLGISGCILIVFVDSVTVSLISWSLLGTELGVTTSAAPVTTAKLLDKCYMATGMGVVMTLTGIGILFGGPLNGYIRDITGNYHAVFFTTTAFLVAAAIVILAARWFRQAKVSQTRNDQHL